MAAQPEWAFSRLAIALLAATTVDELLAQAPLAIAAVLGAARSYHIDLLIQPSGSTAESAGDDRARLCIPLRAEGRLLGTIVVSDAPGSCWSPLDLNDRLVVAVAELVATAVATRQRLDAEQAGLREKAAELQLDAVSILSHEMRTPLASIKGYATALLLEDVDWDDTTRGEFLQAIDQESDHLIRLIEDILEAAAIEAGGLRIEPEPLLVPVLVKRVVERMAIQSRHHRFVLDFPPDFPVVEADAQRIEQVLTNLLDNAVKYSRGGLIVVRGEARADDVVISVVDQGVGIAPEDLNQLFERFFRASRERQRRSLGTGLGLPISQAIVRAHGGRIWAESRVGHGTTLSFTIPHPPSDTGRQSHE